MFILGHTHNVTVVCFHPTLPIIISGSEDNTIRIWHAHTYRLEKTLNYGWERVWALAYLKGLYSFPAIAPELEFSKTKIICS